MTRGARWIVGGECDVRTVLAKMADPAALAEGRVFVDGRRSTENARLRPGSVVEVNAPREPVGAIRILAERDGLYAVDKPAGISTDPDRRGFASVVRSVVALVGAEAGQVHAVGRLDLPVSGVVVVATTAAARLRAEQARSAGALVKRYVAITSRTPDAQGGTWRAPVEARGKKARPAETRWAVTARAAPSGATARSEALSPALLVLEPVTGRLHQLRVHAAQAGAALLGDPKYGGASSCVTADGRVLAFDRVMLHAFRVSLRDERGEWSATSPVPDALTAAWAALGGQPAAWARAYALDLLP